MRLNESHITQMRINEMNVCACVRNTMKKSLGRAEEISLIELQFEFVAKSEFRFQVPKLQFELTLKCLFSYSLSLNA